VTGYLMNISAIDRAVREHVVPLIAHAVATSETDSPARLLLQALRALHRALGSALTSIRWNLTPYYSIAMTAAAPDRVLLRQSFEFAAAHRLHVDALDDRANRDTFGKCNNPSGHGHNYRVEVCVEAPLSSSGDLAFTLQALEQVVDQRIIQRFDHKHLNRDTGEFAALNPSVENIARVCHGLLVEPIRQAGARLARVTVWETEKTSCSYPA
jgi:6-pyruvoyltetrahydropterin/6-carboxytetrahydropterin synthase